MSRQPIMGWCRIVEYAPRVPRVLRRGRDRERLSDDDVERIVRRVVEIQRRSDEP